MRHSKIPVSRGLRGSRGGRVMIPGSLGSKASIRPSATAVIMLIHRIWVGRIGSVAPIKIAARITRPSAMFVGKVQTMNLVRLSNTPRPSSTAASMVAKSSSVRTISAASLATSVPARPMATPMSALRSAGASLTPSPVMATTSPRDWNASTNRSFCSGETRANTTARPAASAYCSGASAARSVPVSTSPSRWDGSMPREPATAAAVAARSPVIIFTAIPAPRAAATAAAAAGRGGSIIACSPVYTQRAAHRAGTGCMLLAEIARAGRTAHCGAQDPQPGRGRLADRPQGGIRADGAQRAVSGHLAVA